MVGAPTYKYASEGGPEDQGGIETEGQRTEEATTRGKNRFVWRRRDPKGISSECSRDGISRGCNAGREGS